MSGSHALTVFDPGEYDAIAETMGGSARGRWFLDEYARRNRTADTDMLLGAMARLESAVTAGRGPDGVDHLRGDLMEMASAISRTKAEIAAISDPSQDQTRLSTASEALDAIVRATERATTDILGAAEEVQEIAWVLRERDIEAAVCDALDRHATQIYTACSFQDLTAQRTSRIVHTLRYLEERLVSMIAIWGEAGAPVPAAPGEAMARPAGEPRPEDLCQSDVDRYIDMAAPQAVAATHAALRAIEPGAIPLHDDIVFLPTVPEAEALDVEFAVDWAEEASSDLTAADRMAEAATPWDVEEADPDPPAPARDTAADEPVPAPETALSLDEIDALSIEEKFALFC